MAYILLFPLLSGCDQAVSGIFDFLSGVKTNTIVLSNKPLRLGLEPLMFTVETDAKIIGGRAAVCVLLRDDYPIRPAGEMNEEFKRLMKGADIFCLIKLANGTTVKMGRPNQSWSRFGALGNRNELSACMNISVDKSKLPVGSSISSIEISSDVELDVKGVYWESTNKWDSIK